MASISKEGETCWRLRRADRVSVIIDAADFFRHSRNAMMKAKRSIFMIGWDFDTRIDLIPGKANDQAPEKLGRFLNWLAKHEPQLDIRILKWDVGLLHSVTRGETPFYILKWMYSKQVRLKLDSAHPPMSAHHMKLLVIDDQLAFCGGIDMTVGRWDTQEHLEKDKRRRSPLGWAQGPWHDATTCISGPAAASLGDLARIRWEHATGEKLDACDVRSDPWPDGLIADYLDIEIGIARTSPQFAEQRQVIEIEAATLAIIKTARRYLYIESQYFASRKIAEAIAERLREDDGPEIIIINPKGAEGWLEAKAMDSARVRLMKLVQQADLYNRFRIMYPVNEAGTPIYVHAKIMISDDRVLKLGSANLNNRSMGYDTECDVIIEAQGGQGEVARMIMHQRDALLAEHLGVDISEIRQAIERCGSSIRAIDCLANPDGRRLRPVPIRDLTIDEEMLAESDLADPERPSGVTRRLYGYATGRKNQHA